MAKTKRNTNKLVEKSAGKRKVAKTKPRKVAKTKPRKVAKTKPRKVAKIKPRKVAKIKPRKVAKTKPRKATQRNFVRRLESAIALQHVGDNQAAADAFMDLFVDFPDDARLPEEAGNITLFALNQPLKAIDCYAKALPLVDDATELCHKIGFAYASANDDENASLWFAQAHQHTPTHSATFLEVAKMSMRAEKFDDALAYFDTAWAHHVMDTQMFGGPSPHFQALVLMNQARIRLLHLDRVDDGIAGLRPLIADMGDQERGRTLAQELIDVGKPAIAIRVLDIVLAEAPKDKAAITLRKSLVS
jgi:tetratricopeptide (TPR) repeat protein